VNIEEKAEIKRLLLSQAASSSSLIALIPSKKYSLIQITKTKIQWM
jgi:hypothetical protein